MLMYELWYDYIKPKYSGKVELCYMDADTRFDHSNYELGKLLLKEKTKKLIGLMGDELGGKIMTKFVGLRAMKRKLKFENYINGSEATELDNKTKYLEKNKFNIDSFKKFISNNK